MRAIAIILIAAALGYFGYYYTVEGRSPSAAIGELTGETARAEAEAQRAAV
ncbi:hypothetical protein [Yoonia sediminilitoris]|nr:hypothetical protein [Yoonia sediminilitoris]